MQIFIFLLFCLCLNRSFAEGTFLRKFSQTVNWLVNPHCYPQYSGGLSGGIFNLFGATKPYNYGNYGGGYYGSSYNYPYSYGYGQNNPYGYVDPRCYYNSYGNSYGNQGYYNPYYGSQYGSYNRYNPYYNSYGYSYPPNYSNYNNYYGGSYSGYRPYYGFTGMNAYSKRYGTLPEATVRSKYFTVLPKNMARSS